MLFTVTPTLLKERVTNLQYIVLRCVCNKRKSANNSSFQKGVQLGHSLRTKLTFCVATCWFPCKMTSDDQTKNFHSDHGSLPWVWVALLILVVPRGKFVSTHLIQPRQSYQFSIKNQKAKWKSSSTRRLGGMQLRIKNKSKPRVGE